jgi:hypothetical protein
MASAIRSKGMGDLMEVCIHTSQRTFHSFGPLFNLSGHYSSILRFIDNIDYLVSQFHCLQGDDGDLVLIGRRWSPS